MNAQRVVSLCLIACLLTTSINAISMWDALKNGAKNPFRREGKVGSRLRKPTQEEISHAHSCIRIASGLGGNILKNHEKEEDLIIETRSYMMRQIDIVHKLRCDDPIVHKLIEEERSNSEKC